MSQGHGRKDDEHRDAYGAEDSRAVKSCDESALRLFDQPGRQARRDGGRRPEAVAHRKAGLFAERAR